MKIPSRKSQLEHVLDHISYNIMQTGTGTRVDRAGWQANSCTTHHVGTVWRAAPGRKSQNGRASGVPFRWQEPWRVLIHCSAPQLRVHQLLSLSLPAPPRRAAAPPWHAAAPPRRAAAPPRSAAAAAAAAPRRRRRRERGLHARHAAAAGGGHGGMHARRLHGGRSLDCGSAEARHQHRRHRGVGLWGGGGWGEG